VVVVAGIEMVPHLGLAGLVVVALVLVAAPTLEAMEQPILAVALVALVKTRSPTAAEQVVLVL